jgi:lipoprotein-anchoring transpeptidase ErfK/SrfK
VTTYDRPGPGAARRRLLLAVMAAAVVTVAASGIALAVRGAGSAVGSVARPTGPVAAVPTPVLRLPGRQAGGRVAWSQPLTVAVTDGELVRVAVRGPDDADLAGVLADSRTWRSSGPLLPDAPYDVLALVRDGAGGERWQPAQVTTAPADKTLKAALSPGDDAVVGVGMPVIVRLDGPVKDPAARAALVQRLSVRSAPAVDGAWRWISADELHYRPAQFWAPGTRISVRADLDRLALPDGVWGAGVRTTSYTVGDALVSTVDVNAKTMTVRRNGQVLRVLPASMGRPEFATRNGTHLVLEKYPSKVLDSATVGLPGEYQTKVDWAVRLTYSGTFTHSAPWSVQDQGVRNVSHGCVNLSPADAKWFYDQTRRGDVVQVVGSTVGPKLSDPGAMDWNVPFEEWKRGPAG